MNTSRSDRWTALDTPQSAEQAADRLRQLSTPASEQDAREHNLRASIQFRVS